MKYSRITKPADEHRYYDGSVWHPHFAWVPVWVGNEHEWLRWVWKRAYHIELTHHRTTDFLSRKALG